MLMDLFYDNVQVQHKMRIHFHAFMQDFHKRMSSWNEIGVRLGKEREENALSLNFEATHFVQCMRCTLHCLNSVMDNCGACPPSHPMVI
jgi:predicted ATPase